MISAKISPNLEQFASAKQLTSWTGLCPASYKSGGVRKSAHTSAGSEYLKALLYQCGGNAGRSSNIIFPEFYGRISKRRSKKNR
ncbi:transposase [Enterococcus hulanensis]|uniref:transposase n=1 Tax=Enterococcus hulanensis TaxID=2559929 RepID=UPI0036F41159